MPVAPPGITYRPDVFERGSLKVNAGKLSHFASKNGNKLRFPVTKLLNIANSPEFNFKQFGTNTYDQ